MMYSADFKPLLENEGLQVFLFSCYGSVCIWFKVSENVSGSVCVSFRKCIWTTSAEMNDFRKCLVITIWICIIENMWFVFSNNGSVNLEHTALLKLVCSGCYNLTSEPRCLVLQVVITCHSALLLLGPFEGVELHAWNLDVNRIYYI